jgi:hypothetical protein
MERLTDPCWKNLDPWECCGQDYYCKRGCHDKGGCTNGCIVPKLYARLAAYEDTGLTPEEIKAPFTEDTMINLAAQALGVEPSRLRELAEADKDGRVVVLPCKGYSSIDIARDGVSYRPDHWNIYLTAHAHGQNTTSRLKVGLFDIGEVERAMQEMEGKS